jgi:hypothetical protein
MISHVETVIGVLLWAAALSVGFLAIDLARGRSIRALPATIAGAFVAILGVSLIMGEGPSWAGTS